MKILSKIAVIAISAALAACAFGCGSSGTSAQSGNPGFEPQDIEINDPGFTVTDEGKMSFAFVAVNPNEGHLAENVIFTVEAYDAGGSMIAGGGITIPALYPGTETAGAGEADLFSRDTATPEVASLSIVAMMDSITWTETDITASDIEKSVSIVKPRKGEDDNGALVIWATIEMDKAEDVRLDTSKPIEMRAVALLFDEDGNAICGTDAVTFTLEPEGAYDLTESIANPPSYAESMLYVTPAA